MQTYELLLIAVGLSMDAFAVAICAGLSAKSFCWKNALTVGLYFGFFQAAMPLAGYFLASRFSDRIEAFDHWIAFALLALIGANMIRESFSPDDDDTTFSLSPRKMFPMAIATSIDALAVGASFAFLRVDILPAVSSIGIITFLFSMAGVKLGSIVGLKYRRKAERFGGVILILIGIKIVLDHLGLLGG